ncbi:MAG TPA: histidine kinase dimerization/phospho-acceptor domain-containing protein [Bryobacteraceae bacterium]|nr:histidine kinase dimerization/phospho-acceptor domain-containing protein [Bryobacteraceae bacterium]
MRSLFIGFSPGFAGETGQESTLIRDRESKRGTRRSTELKQAIYTLVHDLREPLRQIKTQTQFLEGRFQKMLDDETSTMFESVMAGIERMNGMIDATLSLGERTHESADVSAVDPREVLDSVLRDLPMQEIQATVRVGHLRPVAAKRENLHHIFQNLLGNAMKYRS